MPRKKTLENQFETDGLLLTTVPEKCQPTISKMSSTPQGYTFTASQNSPLPGEWAEQAACKNAPPNVRELFFGSHVCTVYCDMPRGCEARLEQNKRERVEAARKICDSCPVEYECQEWAIETRLEYGVAGGLTERERTRIVQQDLAIEQTKREKNAAKGQSSQSKGKKKKAS